jgi:hypothetical protein
VRQAVCRFALRPVAVLVCLVASATATSAQTAEEDRGLLPARSILVGEQGLPAASPPDLATRTRELQRWTRAYNSWKQWRDKWANRSEPGWFTAYRDRVTRPDPPEWLSDDCLDLADDEGVLADACALLSEWKDDYATAQLKRETVAARAQHEAPTKSLWWEHLHVDGLWPMAQWRASVYGMLGMHATVDVAGRFQVFVAPGVILLNLPSVAGGRELKPATDWGFAYRLTGFRFPGTERRGVLHLNVAKAWVFAGPSNVFRTSVDLVGFSVTLKHSPQP